MPRTKTTALALLLLSSALSACSATTPAAQAGDVGIAPQPEAATPPAAEEPAAAPATETTPPESAGAEAAPAADEAPSPAEASSPAPTTPYDVAPWQAITSTYVTEDGGFRYEALRGNAEHVQALAAFVRTIGSAAPGSWSRDEQLAFYINAYNALTISSVLELWPVESVMRERGFFNRRQHTVAGERITLDHLENRIIRPRFSEPRIHFAVNCASVGCPALAPVAITAANLEATLDAQARAFVRSSTRIERDRTRVRLSQIFEWFADDFGGRRGVREFVASRLADEDAAYLRASSTRVGFFQYDWDLNSRP